MKKKYHCGRCEEIERDPIVPERCPVCGARARAATFSIDQWLLSLALFLGAAIVLRAALW